MDFIRHRLARGSVFIAYRREDSSAAVGRLYDWLELRLGRDAVFMDVDRIPVGVDFVEFLSDGIARSQLVLAIIGPRWSEVRSADGRRRLDHELDFVRLELEIALRHNIRIIPVLVHGARMPRSDELPASIRALASLNAFEIRDAQFSGDLDRLERAIRVAPVPPTASADPRPLPRKGIWERLFGARAGPAIDLENAMPPARRVSDRHIFISYSKSDMDRVLRFAERLKGGGLAVWMDELNLRVGAAWDEEIGKALKSCTALMIFLSRKSVSSRNVLDELQFAQNNNKEVFPIRLEVCEIPYNLSRVQYIDLVGKFEWGVRKCVDDLIAEFGGDGARLA